MAQACVVLTLIALSGLEPVLGYEYFTADQKEALTPVDPELAAKTLALASTYGLPSSDSIRLFNSLILSYDRRGKGPRWVMEVISKDNFEPLNANRTGIDFKPDTQIHEYFRSNNTDFFMQGFDRGHQAPADNYLSDQAAMNHTFSLSNVWPQTPGLNQGCWVRLEKYLVYLAIQDNTKRIYIVTGPLFLAETREDDKMYVRYQVIGDMQVAVPTHFFKVFLRETTDGKLIMDAFVMPNSKEGRLWNVRSILEFRVPLENLPEIERASGLIFFGKLDRNNVTQPDGFEFNHIDKKIAYDSTKTNYLHDQQRLVEEFKARSSN